MTKLLVTLPNEQDVNWLIPLLHRLGIDVAQFNDSESPKDEAYHKKIVGLGGQEQADFASYLTEFEESRKDRILPLRG